MSTNNLECFNELLFLLCTLLAGVPTALVKQVVDATIDQLELTPHRFKQAKSLSGGMKRKLCVAIALIGDPEVVLLDEPSAGMCSACKCIGVWLGFLNRSYLAIFFLR